MSATSAPSAAQRQFPCKECGANLQFDPGSGSLKCPYCGALNEIAQSPENIRELDYLAYLHQLPDGDDVHETIVVKCTSCAAETTLAADVTAGRCPFCGCGIVATGSSRKSIRPQGLLPFRITHQQSSELFRRWVAGLWFAPTALRQNGQCSAIRGAYIPAWTYDSDTETDYTGQRGDDYWDTETYTETDAEGNSVTRSRQVQKTRWSFASGHVGRQFDDVLIMASQTLPPKCLNRLEPWDLPALVAYEDEYLSGFVAESYQVNLGDGFERAKTIMDGVIRQDICRDIGGNHQRIDSVNTQYGQITFKHLLLPIWISAYQFQGRTFRFLVNARTGEVQGERPYSWMKITLLVLAVLAAILMAVLVVSR